MGKAAIVFRPTEREVLNQVLAGLRIKTVKEQASVPQAMQVVRDLCLVARAEGHISASEEAVLNRVADGLGVPREFVCQTMEGELEPD